VNSRRLWGAGQLGLGGLLLVAPRFVTTACAGQERPPPIWLVRLLGGRLLGQGGMLIVRPTPGVLAFGRAIDTVHGSSMVVTAVAKPEFRRSALTSGLVAAASIFISMAVRD
jgi:hypothetical protein